MSQLAFFFFSFLFFSIHSWWFYATRRVSAWLACFNEAEALQSIATRGSRGAVKSKCSLNARVRVKFSRGSVSSQSSSTTDQRPKSRVGANGPDWNRRAVEHTPGPIWAGSPALLTYRPTAMWTFPSPIGMIISWAWFQVMAGKARHCTNLFWHGEKSLHQSWDNKRCMRWRRAKSVWF